MKKLLAMLFLFAAGHVHAADEVFVTESGAIQGYDPVAYFMAGEPVKGDSRFTYEWNGANWHFANVENLATFRSDPDKYAPQYGGYCAYGMSQGYKVGTDPAAFTIVDSKLYLNYSIPVRATWLKDVEGYIAKADRNWSELKHTSYEK